LPRAGQAREQHFPEGADQGRPLQRAGARVELPQVLWQTSTSRFRSPKLSCPQFTLHDMAAESSIPLVRSLSPEFFGSKLLR
jgi:hypothetical protein